LFSAAFFYQHKKIQVKKTIKKNEYPAPEFSNEVYYLKKDSINSLIRLEKGSSKMESKTKMGGMGGYEMGYEMADEKSGVRLVNVKNLSFVFSTGASSGSSSSNAERDSMLKANGMDPSMTQGMPGMSSMTDPANSITLYKVEPGKGKRKILLQKSPGAMSFGKKKMMSSDKLTFSIKNIREGYWELVIDKTLSKGEYIFTYSNAMSMGGMSGDLLLFAFGID
jgi:hypothetical protein